MTKDEMAAYSAALDEVYRLRSALAYEASVSEAHGSYKTFPRSRRRSLDDQVERMRASARGGSEVAYAGTSYLSLRHALREAGASETLPRAQLEAELPKRWNVTPGTSRVQPPITSDEGSDVPSPSVNHQQPPTTANIQGTGNGSE